MLAFDHVIFTVRDFDAAAARLLAEHGLASVPGGAHAGHGTGNRIVPLGPNYIELMAVVDAVEAASSPLGRWVSRRAAAGDAAAALCLRVGDISDVAGRLGLEPLAMSRRRPDGSELSWHLAGLDEMLAEGMPFFIEWHAAADELPGAAAAGHEIAPLGLSWVEVGGSAARLDSWLGRHDLDIRVVSGGSGVRRVGIATKYGEVVL